MVGVVYIVRIIVYYCLFWQGQDHWRAAMQRVENLAQQVEQIGLPAPQPPTVQIDIDMSTGCTYSTSSQEINLYKSVSNAVKYIDEVVTRNVCGLCCLNNYACVPGLSFHADYCCYGPHL